MSEEKVMEKKGMALVADLARRLVEIQGKLSDIRSEEKALSSEKEATSEMIVTELTNMGNNTEATGIILDGIGVLKLDTKAYPRLLNADAFIAWGKEVNVQLPPLTVNPATLSSWFSEEQKLNMPLPPEEIMPVFWKTSAKVNKRG